MPRLSQWMIKAALLWFGVGATVGGLMLANKGVPFAPQIWSLYTAHVHMMLIGWTAQFAAGVAFWILPRLDTSGSRGNQRLAALSCVCINAGIAVVLLSCIAQLVGAVRLSMPAALGGVLYAVAAVAFAAHAWPRARPMLFS